MVVCNPDHKPLDTLRETFSALRSGFLKMNTSDSRCGEAHPYTLKHLGWTEEHTQAFLKYTGPYVPGRVACRAKNRLGCFYR